MSIVHKKSWGVEWVENTDVAPVCQICENIIFRVNWRNMWDVNCYGPLQT
jgi:hypothetical protein